MRWWAEERRRALGPRASQNVELGLAVIIKGGKTETELATVMVDSYGQICTPAVYNFGSVVELGDQLASGNSHLL